MADQKILVYLCLLLASVTVVYAAKPQPGIFLESFNEMTSQNLSLEFSKILGDKTKIKLIVTALDCDREISPAYKIQWDLRYTECSDAYLFMGKEDLVKLWNSSFCAVVLKEEAGYDIKTLTSSTQTFSCKDTLTLEDKSAEKWTECTEMKKPNEKKQDQQVQVEDAKPAKREVNTDKKKKKKDDLPNKKKTPENENDPTSGKEPPLTTEKPTVETALTTEKTLPSHVVAISPNAGPFLLNVKIYSTEIDKDKKADFRITVKAEFIHDTMGYLSAHDWPMLVFYGVMCGVYCLFAFAWLICSACVWKDLLRIQFWIGGVIFLGLIEKAAFYAEYHHVFVNGVNPTGVIIFAELMSAFKRSLARMLIVVVSVGFGIVKPRLGSTLHKVLAAGALYFVLAAIEGCMRATHELNDTNSTLMIAGIPLAVLDAVICYWIFSSLFQTIRTLRLRRNLVKLSLYRHFTNTLIFCVVAAIIFIVWSFKTLKTTSCLTDWQELWVDDAYWHMLFCVILMVIMVLWRPTANNQRYAYSPLQDLLEGDEDNEDNGEKTQPSDAFDTMKLRNVGKSNGEMRRPQTTAEDDLKWIEENIPSSVAEAALPTLLDSDEEIMTTRTELNKME